MVLSVWECLYFWLFFCSIQEFFFRLIFESEMPRRNVLVYLVDMGLKLVSSAFSLTKKVCLLLLWKMYIRIQFHKIQTFKACPELQKNLTYMPLTLNIISCRFWSWKQLKGHFKAIGIDPEKLQLIFLSMFWNVAEKSKLQKHPESFQEQFVALCDVLQSSSPD